MAFTILHDGAEIPPSGTPAPSPNTYEITAAPSPTPNAEFPLSIRWQSEGISIGEPNVRVLNFVAALDQFLVTRGTGEQSNVVTVRKLLAPPPPPPACTHWFTDEFVGAVDTALEDHTPDVVPAGGFWEPGFFKLNGAGAAVPVDIAVGGGNTTNVFAPNVAIGTDYIVTAVLTRPGSADQAIAVRVDGNGLSYLDIGLTLVGTNALAVLMNNQAGGLSFLILSGLAANPNPRTVVVKIIGGLSYEIYLDGTPVGSGASATPFMSEFNRVRVRNAYNAGPPAENVAVNSIDITDCGFNDIGGG